MGKFEGKFILGKNLEKVIHELKVGEEGWVCPESLEVDYDLNVYLNTSWEVSNNINEKKEMTVYVKRIGEEKDAYYVNINKVKDYFWTRTQKPFYKTPEEILNGENYIVQITNNNTKSIDEQIEEALKNEDYELVAKLKKRRDLGDRL